MKTLKILFSTVLTLSFFSAIAGACDTKDNTDCSEAGGNKVEVFAPYSHADTGDPVKKSDQPADTNNKPASIYPKSYIVPVGVCEQDLPPSQIIERE